MTGLLPPVRTWEEAVTTLERMQREKSDLERATVGNRGHVSLLDEPEVLAGIDRFLARLRP